MTWGRCLSGKNRSDTKTGCYAQFDVITLTDTLQAWLWIPAFLGMTFAFGLQRLQLAMRCSVIVLY